jgi:outer membrane protein assembly factor BamA
MQGETGTVGSARLELGNVLGTGRQVGLFWQARGPGLADLAAHYVEPLLLGLPMQLELGLEQQVQDTFYVRTRWGGRLGYALTGRERVTGGYDEERVVQPSGEVEEASMQYTVFGLERVGLDRPFAPRRGTRAKLGAAQIFKRERLRTGDERVATASAVDLKGEWHVPVRRAAGVALEVMTAGRFSSQPVLPVWERYPLGGAATLRGYDEEAFRVDRYALSRLEWRWFLGTEGQRVFMFWDHASMATRVEAETGGLHMDVMQRDGYGAGLRLETRGGLIGVDYGLAAGRPPLEGKIHLQLVSTF